MSIQLKHLWQGGVLLSAAIGISACKNLETRKFEPTESTPGQQLAGVPFTLNKPQLTLTHTAQADATPESYTVAVTYVPDPENKYTLQIDPSMLSSVDFTMSYDGNGGLSGVNAKTADQTIAILTSLGKLAVGVLGVADKGGVGKDPVGEVEDSFQKAIDNDTPFLDPDSGTLRKLSSAEKAVWPGLKTRLEAFRGKGKLDDSSFLYEDRLERNLFLAARARMQADNKLVPNKAECDKKKDKSIGTDYQELKCTWKNGTTDADAAVAQAKKDQQAGAQADAVWSALLVDVAVDNVNRIKGGAKALNDPTTKQIDDALTAYDMKSLTKLKAKFVTDNQSARAVLDRDAVGGKPADEDVVAFWSTVALQQLEQAAEQQIVGVDDGGGAFLIAMTELDPADWQSRKVAELNKAIAQRQALDRIPAKAIAASSVDEVDDLEDGDDVLKGLQRRKAALLGVLPAYDRLQDLKSSEPDADHPKKQTALDSEVAALQKQISDAEAAAKPAAAAPKAEPSAPVELVRVDTSIKGHTLSEYVLDTFKGQQRRPNYAVVIEPAPHPDFLTQVDSGASAAPATSGAAAGTPAAPATAAPAPGAGGHS